MALKIESLFYHEKDQNLSMTKQIYLKIYFRAMIEEQLGKALVKLAKTFNIKEEIE